MDHEPITTLTLNPAIDGACEAQALFATHKIRTNHERYEPGGGGINVARVLQRLGVGCDVVYLAGGATGGLLDDLLNQAGLHRRRFTLHDHTRQSLSVYERSTGLEYRFVPEGPMASETEWRVVLDHCAGLKQGWLIASGSLTRGIPSDFYAQLVHRLSKHVKLVIDTSGPALAAVVATGGLHLIKPSKGEFEALIGRELDDDGVACAASEIVASGKCAHVAVSMGHRGAVFAWAGGVRILPALDVTTRSTTGAGDSFVAGIVYGFMRGMNPESSFHYGMAAGTAAVLNAGTGLAHADDIEKMLALIKLQIASG